VNTTRYKFILPRCESFSLIEYIASYIRGYNYNPTQHDQTIHYMYIVPTYQQDKPTTYLNYYLYMAPTYQQDKPTTYIIYYLYIAPTYQQDKPATYITILAYINPSTIYIIKKYYNFVKPISGQSHRIWIC